MPDDRYTHGHHDAVLRSHRNRTIANSAAYLRPHLASGQRVLDVGCGPGTITAEIAAVVAPGEVVAIDRAADVLDEARAVCAEHGVDNVTITVGDVYALDFADDSFDVVHAHQVLQHLSDPVAALVEMARVCRPGGVVAARDADYAGMTWHPADPRIERWMEIYQGVARANDAEPNGGRHLLAWANAAKAFDRVEVTASVWCYAEPISRSWWGGLWSDRVTATAMSKQATQLGLANATDLEWCASGFRDWAEHPDGWFTVPHGEILAWV
ncbi:MAG: methyltransferase domain-containing protein [Actinomycetota bacterium]